jgi:hypothetical protein
MITNGSIALTPALTVSMGSAGRGDPRVRIDHYAHPGSSDSRRGQEQTPVVGPVTHPY